MSAFGVVARRPVHVERSIRDMGRWRKGCPRAIFPGAAIFLIVAGLSLFCDALRDAFDVRLREDS